MLSCHERLTAPLALNESLAAKSVDHLRRGGIDPAGRLRHLLVQPARCSASPNVSEEAAT
jgi:hypothetical protein